MALMFGAALVAIRLITNSAWAAVEADAVLGALIYDGFVVDVVYVGHVDVGDGAVVVVIVAAPVAAKEASTRIAEAVVNSAVETDVRSPVAGVPNVETFAPTPITGRPKVTGLRGYHPRTGNPEIVLVVVIVGPITRHPEIAWSGADRLRVNGQSWRADADRNAHGNLSVGWGWHRQDSRCNNEKKNKTCDTHDPHLSGVCWASAILIKGGDLPVDSHPMHVTRRSDKSRKRAT